MIEKRKDNAVTTKSEETGVFLTEKVADDTLSAEDCKDDADKKRD